MPQRIAKTGGVPDFAPAQSKEGGVDALRLMIRLVDGVRKMHPGVTCNVVFDQYRMTGGVADTCALLEYLSAAVTLSQESPPFGVFGTISFGGKKKPAEAFGLDAAIRRFKTRWPAVAWTLSLE